MAALQKYSGIFGQPGQGVHSIRFAGFALVDLLLTAVLAASITKYGLSSTSCADFLGVFALLIVIAVCVHSIFGVNTRLNSLVFNQPWPNDQTSEVSAKVSSSAS